jgi:hypothetical protein
MLTPPHALGLSELQRHMGNRAVVKVLFNTGPTSATGPTPRRDSASATIRRVMASVRFDVADAANPFVKKASVERGSGTSGGAHSTAYVVFVDTVINAVLGKDFPTAVGDLLALCNKVPTLPGYKRVQPMAATDATIAAAIARVDDKLIEINAKADYQNTGTTPQVDWVPILQDLMVDYLALRNVAPGTYVPTDLKPSGMKGVGEKQEKEGAELMYKLVEVYRTEDDPKDPGGRLTKTFAKGMWLCFDEGILPKRISSLPLGAWFIQISPAIAQHVIACFDAYPEIEVKQESIQSAFLRNHVAPDLGIESKKSIDEFIMNVQAETKVGL